MRPGTSGALRDTFLPRSAQNQARLAPEAIIWDPKLATAGLERVFPKFGRWRARLSITISPAYVSFQASFLEEETGTDCLKI